MQQILRILKLAEINFMTSWDIVHIEDILFYELQLISRINLEIATNRAENNNEITIMLPMKEQLANSRKLNLKIYYTLYGQERTLEP